MHEKIRVHCKLCAGNKTLSCAQNTTFNFKRYSHNTIWLAIATQESANIISLLIFVRIWMIII